MANIGTYLLATNTGAFDQLILMSDVLYTNIQNVIQKRAQMGFTGADLYPLISDIEQTHVIIPRNSYKPYVPISFQYLKESPTAGAVGWGNTITFNLDNFGEFYWDAFMVLTTAAFTTTPDTTTLPTLAGTGSGGLNNTTSTNVTVNGVTLPPASAITLPSGTLATSSNAQFNYYRFVDSTMNALASTAGITATTGSLAGQPKAAAPTANSGANYNYVYYCDNLAHNLFTAHEFDVNSTKIDAYTQYTDAFYLNYEVPVNKLPAYLRCIGQEAPIRGVYSGFGYDQTAPSQATVGGIGAGAGNGTFTSTTFALASGGTNPFAVTAPSTDNYGSPTSRHQVGILNGPQTPKFTQPSMLIIYPYKFDFCESPSNALPVLQIPGAPRIIKSTFNTQANVLFTKSPVFVERNAISLSGTSVSSTPDITNSYVNTTYVNVPLSSTVTAGTNGVASSAAPFSAAALYINNIFIDRNIHDIYIQRVSLALTRVHLSMAMAVTSSGAAILLNTFKWAVEYLYVGVQPIYSSGGTPTVAGADVGWDKFQQFTPRSYYTPTATTGAFNSLASPSVANSTQTLISAGLPIVYQDPTDIMTALAVAINTLQLFQSDNGVMPARFYDSYVPFRVGGYNISNNSLYAGNFLVNFAFYPREKNPNGYANISRSREFNLYPTINSNINLTAGNGYQLIAEGKALNFYYISLGNLNLRFN